MISVTISGIDKVRTTLEKVSKINNIVSQWMKSGSPDVIMQKSFLDNFRSEGRPRWAPLSDETVRQRDYLGYGEGPILQRSGKLMDEVTSLKGKISISSMMSQIVWGIEGLSSEAKRKFGPNQTGKGRYGQTLPARPMIGFQKSDGKKMVDSLEKWILRQLI